MGRDADETMAEIEATREDLARKVDLLVDQAKVEAGELGRKVALGAAAVAGLIVIGLIAKSRVGR